MARVSKNFVENFEKVSRYYLLREHGEYEEAKETARRDLPAAIVCFAELAREIDEGFI